MSEYFLQLLKRRKKMDIEELYWRIQWAIAENPESRALIDAHKLMKSLFK